MMTSADFADFADFTAVNERRLYLVEKLFADALSIDEAAELVRLDAIVDAAIGPVGATPPEVHGA